MLAAALACNMPVRQAPSYLSPADLKGTLQAIRNQKTSVESPGDFVEDPESHFPGLATATQSSHSQQPTPLPTPSLPEGWMAYFAQSGDTLPALSARFNVLPSEITSLEPVPADGYLSPGQLLLIPDRLENVLTSSAVLPDSEIIYSPSTVGFSVDKYLEQTNGFLRSYQEEVKGEILTGAQIVEKVAVLTSTNPRALLALLEFRSGWVLGQPETLGDLNQPLGFNIPDQQGLYRELSIAANQLNSGYYHWRDGTITELSFPNKTKARIAPALNAGTAAVQRLFSFFYSPEQWLEELYGPGGFTELYVEMFGDPWERAAIVEPILPENSVQPPLELPFLPGERWSLTGGPHYSWNAGSPRGALDFSAVEGGGGCKVSSAWVTASAPGLVVRTGEGIVVIDLDGDGYEQTGWVLFYLHIAEKERVKTGQQVMQDQRLGHPSCEGGFSTGNHVHIARKLNGEWIPADGPLPFTLSGWEAYAGEKNYSGGLHKDGLSVTANPSGSQVSSITR